MFLKFYYKFAHKLVILKVDLQINLPMAIGRRQRCIGSHLCIGTMGWLSVQKALDLMVLGYIALMLYASSADAAFTLTRGRYYRNGRAESNERSSSSTTHACRSFLFLEDGHDHEITVAFLGHPPDDPSSYIGDGVALASQFVKRGVDLTFSNVNPSQMVIIAQNFSVVLSAFTLPANATQGEFADCFAILYTYISLVILLPPPSSPAPFQQSAVFFNQGFSNPKIQLVKVSIDMFFCQ